MLALLLLAQVASTASAPPAKSPSPVATPAAAAAPAPALGKASSAVQAKPRTLTDLAQERRLVKASGGGTLSVAGASGMPGVPAGPDGGTRAIAYPENVRVRNAEAEVKAARRALDDEAVRKGMTSEDAAAARRKLDAARRELNDAREAAARQNP